MIRRSENTTHEASADTQHNTEMTSQLLAQHKNLLAMIVRRVRRVGKVLSCLGQRLYGGDETRLCVGVNQRQTDYLHDVLTSQRIDSVSTRRPRTTVKITP